METRSILLPLWQNAEVQLPPHNVRVLFWNGDRVGMCHYDETLKEFVEIVWPMKQPTHWMPLPAPPRS